MFLWKWQSFRDRKWLDLRGIRIPNLRILAECSNNWVTRARHLLSNVFEYWLWRYRYFCNKVTFEILTVSGHRHSFSTHEQMFLWKCRSVRASKCFDPKGTPTLTYVFIFLFSSEFVYIFPVRYMTCTHFICTTGLAKIEYHWITYGYNVKAK